MQDRRKSPRKAVNYPIPIFDHNQDHLLGHLVDISLEGFLLLSPDPLAVGRVYQVRLELPAAFGGTIIEIGVESLWQDESNTPGKYWTGFQIIDISPDNQLNIQTLIDEQL